MINNHRITYIVTDATKNTTHAPKSAMIYQVKVTADFSTVTEKNAL